MFLIISFYSWLLSVLRITCDLVLNVKAPYTFDSSAIEVDELVL